MLAAGKIILAIDTSDKQEAERLAALAKDTGAELVKMGLELSSATSWQWCAELAEEHGLAWVADAKLDDIPNTVAAAAANIAKLEHPPMAITVHATVGIEAMKLAQNAVGDIKLLGITVLTSISDEEAVRQYGKPARQKVLEFAADIAEAGLGGIVASPMEVADIKHNPRTKDLYAMIPGTRSSGADKADQARTTTPAEAIRAGADLLVIGRQVTKAENPKAAYERLLNEIEEA